MSHFGPNMNILGTSLLFSYHSPKVGLDCLTDSWRVPWVLVPPIGRTCNTIQLIILNTNFLICWLKVRLHAGHVPPREMNGSGWVIKFQRTNSHEQNLQNNQWDRYRIFRSGPRVPGCYNGEIQSFYAESGPIPDHLWHFGPDPDQVRNSGSYRSH